MQTRLTHTIYLGTIGILVAVLAYLLVQSPSGPVRGPTTIAVLPFVAMSHENSASRLTDK